MMHRARRFESKVKALADLRIFPIPTTPMAVTAIVRSGDYSTVVAVDAENNLFSSEVQAPPHYPLDTSRLRGTVQGLVKLGVLSQAALDEHTKQVLDARDASQREGWATSMLHAAEMLGVGLTAAQKATLATHTKENDND